MSRAGAEQADVLRLRLAEIDRALSAAPAGDLADRFIEQAHEAFDLLAVATDNDRLLEVCRSLAGEMSRVWTVILSAGVEQEMLQAANSGWELVLDERDGDRAAENAGAFIQASHAAAMRVLQTWPSVRSSEVVPLRP